MNYFVIPGIERPIQKPKSLVYYSQKRIVGSVLRYFDIEFSDIKNKTKATEICFKRQIAMYLLSKHTDYTFRAIARVFGMRDHSTVFCACKNVEDKMYVDERIAAQIKEIQENF